MLEKPGRSRQEPPRRWQGRRVTRPVAVVYADGRLAVETRRFLVVHSSPLAHQTAIAYTAAQAKEVERLAEPSQRGEARWFAGAADAEEAMAQDESRGQGRRGRQPHPWRYHPLRYRVAAVSVPKKRARRGRRLKTEVPQVEVRYRLVGHREALVASEDTYGWTVLATALRPEGCTDAERLQADQAPHVTVEPGFRWRKNPAAISPGGLEKPERLAALAMRTVRGVLVSAVIQRPVRLYLRDHARHLPGNKGPTATPTTAVVFALCTPVTWVHFTGDNAPILQLPGSQEEHRLVCEAVGIDQA